MIINVGTSGIHVTGNAATSSIARLSQPHRNTQQVLILNWY